MRARECAAEAHHAISRVGGAFMVDAGVPVAAERLGLTFFEFYVAGRAGVLGPVDAATVCTELPILNPVVVTAAWERAVEQVDPREAALAYARCNRDWGRRALAGAPGVERAAALASALVDGADLAAVPLVAGWRDLPRPVDPAQQAAHLLQTLREYRGVVHARAVADTGLSPVEAIVSGPDGPERAGLLGWPAPYPQAGGLAERRLLAERLTDDRAAHVFDVLGAAERAEFVAVTGALLNWIRRPPA